MKMLKYTPLALVIVYIAYSLGFSLLPPFRAVTIQEIQTKQTDSLAIGRDRSNILGDSVTIVGRVIAPPRVSPANNDFRTLLRGSTSWQCYIQDTASGLFGGITLRQATRGPQTLIDLIDTGAVIRVKGYVQEFWGTNSAPGNTGWLTQLQIDTLAPPLTIDILQASGKRPTPKAVTIPDFGTGVFPNGTINYVNGEKYEGMYVEFRNVTAGPGLASRQPFSIQDENGNTLYIRDFSNFYSRSPSGDTLVPGWTPPPSGTAINYIRGVIINANNEGTFGSNLPYALVPIYPNDMSVGNAPPQLSAPTRAPGVPTPTDSPTITVTAIDPALMPLTISSVRLFWRTNGGAYSNANMPIVTGNIYSGNLPQTSAGTLVEYFIRAEDNAGGVKLLPSDTSLSKLFYVTRTSDSMSVQDVQYCPNRSGRSGFENASVRGIEGIVTADTTDIRNFSFTSSGGTQSSPARVMIQNGQGQNSGIWISGSPTNALRRGDRVRVKGTVEENFGVTRINTSSASDVVVLGTGQPLPTAENLSTSVFANNKPDGDPSVEPWESVFIRVNTLTGINCINAAQGISCTTIEPLQDTTFRRNFGEILVSDASFVDARIELQDGNHLFRNGWNPAQVSAPYTLLTKNDQVSFYQGILFYSFSNWKLVPRRDSDFGTVTPIGIQTLGEVVSSYQLFQNYPNPFNPSTTIKFSIPVNGFVTLQIFDMLGREVKSLVNNEMTTGFYSYDFNASDLSSGIYFYRIQVNGAKGVEFVNTKRMVLVK